MKLLGILVLVAAFPGLQSLEAYYRCVGKSVVCDFEDYMLRSKYTSWSKTAVAASTQLRAKLSDAKSEMSGLICRLGQLISSFGNRVMDLVELKRIYAAYKFVIKARLAGKGTVLDEAIKEIEVHLTKGELQFTSIRDILEETVDLLTQWDDTARNLSAAVVIWHSVVWAGSRRLLHYFAAIEKSLENMICVSSRVANHVTDPLTPTARASQQSLTRISDVLHVVSNIFNRWGRAVLPQIFGYWIRSELQTVRLVVQLVRRLVLLTKQLEILAHRSLGYLLLDYRCTCKSKTTRKTTKPTTMTTTPKTTTTMPTTTTITLETTTSTPTTTTTTPATTTTTPETTTSTPTTTTTTPTTTKTTPTTTPTTPTTTTTTPTTTTTTPETITSEPTTTTTTPTTTPTTPETITSEPTTTTTTPTTTPTTPETITSEPTTTTTTPTTTTTTPTTTTTTPTTTTTTPTTTTTTPRGDPTRCYWIGSKIRFRTECIVPSKCRRPSWVKIGMSPRLCGGYGRPMWCCYIPKRIIRTTTTTTTTTTEATNTTLPMDPCNKPCGEPDTCCDATDCPHPFDLYILLDSSSQVSQENLGKAKQVISDLFDMLGVGLSYPVGFVTYSEHIDVVCWLNARLTYEQMKNTLAGVRTTGSSSKLENVLQELFKVGFTPDYGDRPGVENIVILFTNRPTGNKKLTVGLIGQLKTTTTLIAVSMGKGKQSRNNYIFKIFPSGVDKRFHLHDSKFSVKNLTKLLCDDVSKDLD